MNEIIFFSLLVLIFLRGFGVLISLDFYFHQKDFKPKLSALGWFLWAIAAIFPLINLYITENFLSEFFLVNNALLSLLGIIYLCWAFLSFFFTIPKRFLAILIGCAIILTYGIFLIVGYSYAIIFISVILNGVWIYTLLKPFVNRSSLRDIIDKRILYFYYMITIIVVIYIPIGVINYLNGLTYGLYDSDNLSLISLLYGYLLIVTFLLILLYVHLEYKISQAQKFDLKDRYSHNLGNALHSIYNAVNLLERKDLSNEELTEIRDLFEKKKQEANDLLREIRNI